MAVHDVSRLRLLEKLLSEDGAIFISIDDNELYNLKMICDEIFGSNCFVSDNCFPIPFDLSCMQIKKETGGNVIIEISITAAGFSMEFQFNRGAWK